MGSRSKFFLLIITALNMVAGGAFSQSLPKSAKVIRVGTAKDIHIDGRLDEAAWQQAPVISGLTQQDPEPGAPTPFDTEIRVLADEENLYFGITCTDPEPSRISAHTMQLDGDLNGDDTVAIAIDPFGDQRNGYFFRTNVLGARQDGLIASAEDDSTNWDGIWDVRTRRTPTGWTAEFRIPAQTLHFPGGHDSWGLNIERYIARKRLRLRWSGTTLDASFYDLRRAGRLEGMAGLRQGMGLSISPYIKGQMKHPDGQDRDTDSDIGGEITYNISPELSAVLTINTDFAETEIDTRQVNLTRFPLFFPEKRAFFLEGSDLFSFGSGLGADFIPFFSRRIGLYEGQEVPLDAGLKVLGTVGKFKLGILDVRAGDTDLTASTNLFAGRMTYDFNDHLRVGLIATDGDPSGAGSNSLFGVDATWRTSTFHGDKNFSVGAWAAASSGDIPDGRRGGWGLKIDYPNDLWDVFALYKEFGEAMDPALGFLPRPGTRWYQGGGAYQPRPGPGAFDWVRQFYFETFVTVVDRLDGTTESWRVFTAPFNAQLESGEHLEANFVPQYEYLSEDFEIAPGVIIPAGGYHFTRYRVEAQSSRHRPWRIGSTIWFGDFYSGKLLQAEAFATWTTAEGKLRMEGNLEYDDGKLPQGRFIQRLMVFKAGWSFNPDTVLQANIQYDSESRNMGVNTRFRWTIRPGNDLFIVYYHDWLHPAGDDGRLSFKPLDEYLTIKLRWTFRP